MFRLIQLMGVVLSLFVMYKSFLLARAKKSDFFELLSWSAFGFLILLYSLGFDFVAIFMSITGMTERTSVILGFSILATVFLVFMIFKQVKTLQLQISMLNDEVSLLRAEKTYKVKRK